MGFRFRKSIKVAPGVRVNLNKRGVSGTVGVKGAHYTVGTQGRRTTAGIPGTGAYYTSQHRWATSKGRRTSTSAAQRQAERAARVQERMAKAAEHERARLYAEHRAAEAEHMSQDVTAHVEELQAVLTHDLTGRPVVNFASLQDHRPAPPFELPDSLAHPAAPPTLDAFLPKALGWIARRFASKRAAYDQAVAIGKKEFEQAQIEHQTAEQERLESIALLQAEHEQSVRQHADLLQQQNAEIDRFEQAYARGEPEAIARYCRLILQQNSDALLPDDVDVAFDPTKRAVIVERVLPPVEVVPEEERFRYIKTQDEIRPVKRSTSDRKTLYRELIASVTLRTAHDILAATDGTVEACTVQGYVDAIRPETGLNGRAYLTSLIVTREAMSHVDLRYVDPVACLRDLGGTLTKNPVAYQST